MNQKNQMLLGHAQNYIRAVMADRLRQEGFSSKGGDDIHWYRVVHKEIVQAIFFYTQHTTLPMFMDIGYGCHPFFITPEFPRSVHVYRMPPGSEVFNPGCPILKKYNRAYYNTNALVTCPNDESAGLDILEEILERLNKIQTPLECYEMHKQQYLDAVPPLTIEQAFSIISTEFMNEVVYWDDKAMYPYCITRICTWIAQLEKDQAKRQLTTYEKKERQELECLKSAILDGCRDEYLPYLEKRRENTIRIIKRKLGMVF